jgi:hypothetical protein
MSAVEWFVSSCYCQEKADELTKLFTPDAQNVFAEILAELRTYLRGRKGSASMIRSRVSNVIENGEPVRMLIFLTMEHGASLPSQQAVFIGPHEAIMRKAQDIQNQYESYLKEEGKDGDICWVQKCKPN